MRLALATHTHTHASVVLLARGVPAYWLCLCSSLCEQRWKALAPEGYALIRIVALFSLGFDGLWIVYVCIGSNEYIFDSGKPVFYWPGKLG